MYKQFTRLTDIYSIQETDGKSVETLIRKDATTKFAINIKRIKYVGQITDESGKVMQDRCEILFHDLGSVIVKMPYVEARELLKIKSKNGEKTRVSGFYPTKSKRKVHSKTAKTNNT